MGCEGIVDTIRMGREKKKLNQVGKKRRKERAKKREKKEKKKIIKKKG